MRHILYSPPLEDLLAAGQYQNFGLTKEVKVISASLVLT